MRRRGIFRRRRLNTAKVMALVLIAGAAAAAAAAATAAAAAAAAPVTVTRVNYHGWPGAYRLANGTVDLVIVPAVGRILRYGFLGGPNALWENPAVAGKPGQFTGDWNNIGGDKIWPWPQDEWEKRTGRAWPPPPATDQAVHQAFVVKPDTVRLVSPVVAGYGLRIVRDIRLAPTGTQVTITSRFEKIRPGADFPTGVWSITQVPVPDWTLARLVPARPWRKATA
jgi:hypothetical protein